ncbi:MAG: DUF459 domain-containing protein [Rhizobiaceae bacterium]|nr:DUF459 domain-containing protein [Rhizobiaceae bacterium]
MRRSVNLRLALATCVAIGIAAPALSVGGATPAAAQETARRSWSLFDIFRPQQRRYYITPDQERRVVKPKRKKAKAPSALPKEPEVTIVEKNPDARTILVIGDFLAGGLAEGLSKQFATDPNISIADRSKGSSGFVRQDYYNWQAELPSLLDTAKPAAVIVMMGSNDRQQMKLAGSSEAVRTDAWMKEYQTRVGAVAQLLEERKIPYLWMGMPSFKITKMTSDMLAFNDVYRAAAQAHKGEFIDIWDGFTDEQGGYVQSGPDVNGQPVKLRASDGINMTHQGKEKLAFYAEKPLRKLLGLNAQGAPLPDIIEDAEPIGPTKVPDRTPPMSLYDPEMDGGTELLGAQPTASQPSRPAPGPAVLPQPTPGRADDFSWARREQQLVPSLQVETTTAIRK